MALPERAARSVPKGRAKARLAPPVPARSGWREFHDFAASVGIELFPWQDTSARYMYATGPDERWLYPECAIVVARQNGKTEILVPHIVRRLLMGRRIMHTAQNRELPREVFGRVADIMESQYRNLLRSRPRFANGQEQIRLIKGGDYRIVAPTRSGARGWHGDDLIIDEVRELDDNDFIGAAKPTLNASRNRQVLYLSNAGDESSEVLNALKRRAAEDPSLAYLEWSAAPERRPDEMAGWLEANPSIGHMPQIVDNLRREYTAHRLAGTLAIFETEHLCRWVVSMRERLVDEYAWGVCERDELPAIRRPYLGIAMDPKGGRASAALAWRTPDEGIALRLLFDVTGSPIDTDRLGRDMATAATAHKVLSVGFDPLTDAALARYFRKTDKVVGATHANASARFAAAVASNRLRWHDADAVTDDLAWTTRKPHDESGSFQAVRADDDRPITAALAALRAVWLASSPTSIAARVY